MLEDNQEKFKMYMEKILRCIEICSEEVDTGGLDAMRPLLVAAFQSVLLYTTEDWQERMATETPQCVYLGDAMEKVTVCMCVLGTIPEEQWEDAMRGLFDIISISYTSRPVMQ